MQDADKVKAPITCKSRGRDKTFLNYARRVVVGDQGNQKGAGCGEPTTLSVIMNHQIK